MSDDRFNISAPPIHPPQEVSAQLQGIVDVLPHEYPNGLELVLYRVGDIAPVVRVGPFPPGSMIWYMPPEMATQVRPVMQASMEAQRKAQAAGRAIINRRHD